MPSNNELERLCELLVNIQQQGGAPSFADLRLLQEALSAELLQPLAEAALSKLVQQFVPQAEEASSSESKVQQIKAVMSTMWKRKYPTYTDLEVLAGIFGMDPLTDILKPLLVLVLNEVGAPSSLVDLVEDTEPLPGAVDQLKDALPKMLERGFPIFYDFEANPRTN